MGLGLFRDLAIKSVIKRLFTHQPIAMSGLRILFINSVLSIFSICLALPFLPLQQAFTAESKNRMGTDKIQGKSRLSMCVDKSSLTFSQSVINCTRLCGCRYFYHMISSSHMSALPKFDFSCDLLGISILSSALHININECPTWCMIKIFKGGKGWWMGRGWQCPKTSLDRGWVKVKVVRRGDWVRRCHHPLPPWKILIIHLGMVF